MIDSGIPADHIIYMANEMIHSEEKNPWPGKLFTLPDPEGPGWDHAAVCKEHYDYTSKHITPEIVLAVLSQDEEKVKQLTGLENPKVFHTTEEDTIFVYYSDHGYEGGVVCGSERISKRQIHEALTSLHERHAYSKMAFFLEACESGSVFDTLPAELNVYAFTSANATELAWSEHCPPDDVVNGKEFGTCMSMFYDNEYQRLWETESTTITLGELFQRTHDHVAKYLHQEVSEYGNLSMRDLPMTTFIGDKPIKARTMVASKPSTLVAKSEVPLHVAKWAAIRSGKKDLSELRDLVYARAKEEIEVMRLGASILGEKEMDQKKDGDTLVYNSACATTLFENLMDKCGHTLPFPSMTRNIVHAICSGEAVPCVNWESICL